jgi:hypothetical protein
VSGLSHFLTQPGFWWGVPAGAIVTGVVAPLITARSLKTSDERKARQENRIVETKRAIDQATDSRKLVDGAVEKFVTAASDMLERFRDTKRLYNVIRDEMNRMSGTPDRHAAEKAAFADARAEDLSKLDAPYNVLKLYVSPDLLTGATKVREGFVNLNKIIDDPMARPVAWKACADALDGLINSYRAEAERGQYGPLNTQIDEFSYLAELRSEIQHYTIEFHRDLQKNGYNITPWDTQ